MKKLSLYFYLILWIVSLAFAQNDLLKIKILSELFALIVFIMPSAFAYLWFLKNRIKIFKYYKKIRIRFRHIFYTIESLVSLAAVVLIISIFSVGGFKTLVKELNLNIWFIMINIINVRNLQFILLGMANIQNFSGEQTLSSWITFNINHMLW